MILKEVKRLITSGGLDKKLSELYGEDKIMSARTRYLNSVEGFEKLYDSNRDIHIFSVSGRSELLGNHTDHNNGKVVAAAIDLDIISVASACAGSVIRMTSEGSKEDCVDFDTYVFPQAELHGTSASIIAGIVSAFKINGYSVGAFDAYTTSSVPQGAGLSSSAAFENTVGTILNYLYNNGSVDFIKLAKISKYAENDFFGKPCGLMDQLACASGGIVAIDFEDSKSPLVERIEFDLNKAGYALCIINTGSSHASLTADYAAISAEMKAVAEHFGKTKLREISKSDVIENIPALRESVGDRAIIRSIHFFDENERVNEFAEAISNADIDGFLRCVNASGRSSFCYLQNVYSSQSVKTQGISLALSLAEEYLKGKKAAVRVHGGGFAGTVQAFVPILYVDSFKASMNSIFGEGSCLVLRVRSQGAVEVIS